MFFKRMGSRIRKVVLVKLLKMDFRLLIIIIKRIRKFLLMLKILLILIVFR